MKKLFLILLAVGCLAFASLAEARTVVIVQTPGVAVAPQATYTAPPPPVQEYVVPTPMVQSAPIVTYQAAPIVTYRTYRVAPVWTYTRTYSVGVAASPCPGGQARHARQAARHAGKAAYHSERANYHASRS